MENREAALEQLREGTEMENEEQDVRILTFLEAVEWNGEPVWVELKETEGPIRAVLELEKGFYWRFRALDCSLTIEVRREYYGKAWRCWNKEPNRREPWEEI